MGRKHRPFDRQFLIEVCLNLLVALFHQLEHLAETYSTNDKGSERDASKQIHVSKVIAGAAGKGIHTHGCQQDADHRQYNTLGRTFAYQPADGCHCNQQQGGHFGRAELQAQVGQERTHEGKNEHPDQATDEGG
ncbi:hypothetical protein SDC9_148705 [bioreactor metagenome]|uniref:Uncharacterized protein n=1 Tax=bioreactor metagenome TaxID=1076179 RepID=A0A645EJ72_9ZZZZ